MGKVSILTKEQKTLLDAFTDASYVKENFYFTGGTALSEFYFQHRESEDLDFFCEHPFDIDVITALVTSTANKLNASVSSRFVDPVNIYLISFSDTLQVKVDFCVYPYPLVENSTRMYNGVRIDSKRDIAINKMVALSQRKEVKDFVDLYFLLKDFTFWDLKEGAAIKFGMDIDPLLFAADVLSVEDFTFLPRMMNDLTLEKLKDYYRQLAVTLGSTRVE